MLYLVLINANETSIRVEDEATCLSKITFCRARSASACTHCSQLWIERHNKEHERENRILFSWTRSNDVVSNLHWSHRMKGKALLMESRQSHRHESQSKHALVQLCAEETQHREQKATSVQ